MAIDAGSFDLEQVSATVKSMRRKLGWAVHSTRLALLQGRSCLPCKMLLQFLMLGMLKSAATWLMLQSNAEVVTVTLLLLILFCAAAVLQSRLTRTARHWAQHRTSLIESEGGSTMSNTTVAELCYARHNRSAKLLLTLLLSLARLTQSTCQMRRYDAKLVMKLRSSTLVVLLDELEMVQEVALKRFMPLEVATCFHVANARMTRAPTQEIRTIALALLDWHVPGRLQYRQLICKRLEWTESVLPVQCSLAADIWKRAQPLGGFARKCATAAHPVTAEKPETQTSASAITHDP